MRRTTTLPARVMAILPLAVALVLLAAPAQARPDGASVMALGLADAVGGSPVGSNALFFNPAGMTLVKQYAVEGSYVYTEALKGHGLTASAVDSKTNPVLGLGVAYTKIDTVLGDLDRTGKAIRGGISGGHSAGGFGFHLGVAVSYIKLQLGETDLTAAQLAELPVDAQDPEVDDVEFTTMDAGVVIQIVPTVRLAVVARNILDTSRGGRDRQPDERPMEIGTGCTLGFQQFEVTFDADMDLETDPDSTIVTYRVGTQFLLGGAVVVRGGFSSDGHDEHQRLGFGLGYVDQMMAVDLGIRATVDVDDGFDAGISFRYFLP
jgi:hypothetical protein